MQLILAAADPMEEVLPHYYLHLGPVGISNHMIMATIAGVLMLLIFPRLFSRPESGPPTGSKNLFESVLEFLRLEVFRPALKEHTDKFVPFLWTMFFFILFCNLLGAIPIAAFIELITAGHVTHFGGAATGNVSTTAALALCAFFYIHAQGIDQIARSLMDGTYGHHAHEDGHGHEAAGDLEHARGEALPAGSGGDMGALTNPTAHYGDSPAPVHHSTQTNPVSGTLSHEDSALAAFNQQHQTMTPVKAILLSIPLYLWNFAPHPFRPKEGESKAMWLADIPMFGLLLLLELIGAVIKPFALCVRLFANMIAGHILLAVLIGLIVAVPGLILRFAIGVPIGVLDIGIQLLELFVAFLQAYIFTFLTTLFIASAVAPEH